MRIRGGQVLAAPVFFPAKPGMSDLPRDFSSICD